MIPTRFTETHVGDMFVGLYSLFHQSDIIPNYLCYVRLIFVHNTKEKKKKQKTITIF